MVSFDNTLMSVHINLLVTFRDVTGMQSHPRETEQIEQFELPVSDEDLRNWVRQGQEADAVISNREHHPESIYKSESGFDWERQTLLLQDGFMRSAFRGIGRKPTPVEVVASDPRSVTGAVDAPMESLHPLALERHDGSLFLGCM